MKKYRLTKFAVISLSSFCLLTFVISLVILNNSSSNRALKKRDYDYVNGTILDDSIPVISSDKKIGKPFNNDDVKVLMNYYEKDSEETIQENSIIFYESTYMQNNAVAYGGPDSFEVTSIYDGTVTSIKEDDILGTIIEIEHDNNVISVYQSVSKVCVKENQVVKKGDVIALSGESNLNRSLKSHLLFELIVDGKIVNPELYYNKNIDEL